MPDDHPLNGLNTMDVQIVDALIADLRIFLWAFDNQGVITAWHGQELPIQSTSPAEALGQSAFTLFKEHPQLIAGARRALEGKAFTTIVQIGDTVLEMRYSPQTPDLDGAAAGAVCLAVDISGRFRMQERFREREERFARAFESAPLGMALLTIEGRFIHTNPTFAELLNQEEDGLLTGGLLELSHRADRARLSELFRKLLAGKLETIHCETRFTRPGPHMLWAQLSISKIEDAQRKPVLLIAQLQDISDYQATFETTGTATVIIQEDTTLVKVNSEFEKLSGYARADLEGKKSWTEFVVEEDRERMLAYHQQRRIEEGSAPPTYEFRFIDRERAVKDIILKIALIPGSTRSVASLLDISAQKTVERALRASEEKYRLVVENASEAIVIAQAGQLKFVNPQAVELTGYSTKNLLSKPLLELVHPDDRDMVGERHVQRLAGADPESIYDFRIVDASGTVRWVQINAVLIEWSGQPATLNFLTDVTQRKLAEKALEKSEHRYRQLVERAADVVYTTDIDGHFNYANSVAETVTGFKNAELLQMHYTDLIPESWREEIQSFYDQQFQRRVAETVLELPILTQSGEERWIEQTVALILEHGRPSGFQGILRDITDRKQTEIALRESEERYRSLVELSPEAISVHSDGLLVYVNPAGIRLFGANSMDELLGKPVLELVHPDYRQGIEARNPRGNDAREPAGIVDEKMLRLNGEAIDVEVATEPITFQGKPAAQMVIRDVTERKQAQVELQRFADRLHMLRRIDRAILEASLPEEVASTTLANLIGLLDCQRASIVIFEHEQQSATVLTTTREHNAAVRSQQMPLSLFEGVLGLGDDEVQMWPDLPGAASSAPFGKILLEQGIRSVLIVPLFAHHEMIGTVNIGNDTIGSFADDQVDVAREVAGPLAVAIQQARLYRQIAAHASELEHRVTDLGENERYLELLNEITKSALAVEDEQVLLQAMADRLGELFTADGCFITLWDEELNQPSAIAAYSPQQDRATTRGAGTPEARALAEAVLKAGKPLPVEDVLNSPEAGAVFADRFSVKSVLGLPLVAGGQRLGAAIILFSRIHEFAVEEIARGEQAAAQVALALAKVQSLASERKRRREAETLRTVSNALVSTLDLKQVLDLILDQLAIVIGFDSASVMLYRENKLEAVVGRGFEHEADVVGQVFPADNQLFQTVLRTRAALWLKDPANDPRFEGWGSTAGIRSWMAVPMLARGKIIGYMTLDSYQPRAYGEAAAALVQPFANQAAQAIENAQLFDWVQRQAVTDALTGLYNRRGLFELGQREIERAHRFSRPLTAIMLDLDHFKRVNDRYGHYTGDQVLVEIANRCMEVLRKVDLLGRYGGEEFAILLPETELETALQIAERIRAKVAATSVKTDRVDIGVTISLGVAKIAHDTEDLAGLLDAADSAMYSAKQAGRNCVRVNEV